MRYENYMLADDHYSFMRGAERPHVKARCGLCKNLCHFKDLSCPTCGENFEYITSYYDRQQDYAIDMSTLPYRSVRWG
jgi:uncharacterized protein YozE (UPF0346 family)